MPVTFFKNRKEKCESIILFMFMYIIIFMYTAKVGMYIILKDNNGVKNLRVSVFICLPLI